MSDLSTLDQLISNRGDSRSVLFAKELTITLSWHAAVDLDLMVFYRAKNGDVGGVYSAMYSEGGDGDLSVFPYMELGEDAGVGAKSDDSEKREVLKIKSLDEISELYLTAVNFTDASHNRASEFASFDGRVNVCNEKGEQFDVVLASREEGSVAVFARIEHTNALIGPVLHNESRIMSFDQLRAELPGADQLSLANKLILQGQGDSAQLAMSSGEVSAQLVWSTSVDLDLHCFYKSRDAREESGGGGFLSSLFGGGGPTTTPGKEGHIYFGDRGRLNRAPYIELDQDAGVGDQGGDNEENMRLGDISIIERALIAVNIYGKPNARFGTYDGRVVVRAGAQEIEVPLTTQEMGAWCVIAEINNESGTPRLINVNRVQANTPSLSAHNS